MTTARRPRLAVALASACALGAFLVVAALWLSGASGAAQAQSCPPGPGGAATTCPAVAFTPTAVSFGNQLVGSAGSPQTITVTNTGSAPLAVSSITVTGTGAPSFAKGADTCTGATLPPGGSCTIAVSFAPTSAGAHAAALTVVDNAPGSPHTVPLTGTGTGTPFADRVAAYNPVVVTDRPEPANRDPALALGPPDGRSVSLGDGGSLAVRFFDNTLTGSGSPQPDLRVHEGGGDAEATFVEVSRDGVTWIAVGRVVGGVSTVDLDAFGLGPAERLFFVRLTDDSEDGDQNGASAAVGADLDAVAALTQAPPTPHALVAPAALAFGSQAVGSASAAQTVTVTNTGSAALTVAGVAVTGANPTDFAKTSDTCSGATIAPAATCSITVAFAPTAVGTRSAAVTIADNAPGSPRSVALTGTAAPAAVAAVTLTPASLGFDSQQVGTVSAVRTVTVTNSGTAPVTMSGATVQGPDAREFPVVSSSCTGPLAPGASCVIGVAFAPAAPTPRSATLVVSDTAAGSPRSVPLSGTGTPPPTTTTTAPTAASTTSTSEPPSTTSTTTEPTSTTTTVPTTTTTTVGGATTTTTVAGAATTTTTTTVPSDQQGRGGTSSSGSGDDPSTTGSGSGSGLGDGGSSGDGFGTTDDEYSGGSGTSEFDDDGAATGTGRTTTGADGFGNGFGTTGIPRADTEVPDATGTPGATTGVDPSDPFATNPGADAEPGEDPEIAAGELPSTEVQEAGPLVVVSPAGATSGPPGVALQVEASGYPPACENVYFFFDGKRIGVTRPTAGTVAKDELSVPGDARQGQHAITSSCRPSGVPVMNTATFEVTEAALHRTGFTTSVPKPYDVDFTPRQLLLSALAALVLLVLVAFAAQLLNRTLDDHDDEVRRWVRWPARDPLVEEGARTSQFGLVVALLALGGPLWFAVQDGGFDASTAVAAIGLSVAIAVVVAAFSLPTFAYLRRNYGERPAVVVVPGAVLLAVVCVVVSRAAGVEPGYFFGLVAGVAFTRRLAEDTTGHLAARSVVVLLVLGMVAWLGLGPVSDAAAQPGAGLGPILAESFLSGVFWVALASLVIALVPLRGLPGRRILHWDRNVWALLCGLALFVFVHVLLLPGSAYVADASNGPAVAFVGLVVAFALASVGLWAYFQYRRQRRPVPVG